MPDQPNIVVTLCDEMRRGAMSCAGDPNVETPALDGLAERGVRFSNACSTYPVCVPARFSFMTGETAHSRSVPAIDYRLSPAETVLPDVLSAAGYETAYVGKWHLAGSNAYRNSEDISDRARLLDRSPVPADQRGRFDHWRGFELRNDPFDTAYFVDDDPEPRELDGYQTDGLVDIAVDLIADLPEPFFLVVSVEPPHPPLNPPAEYLDRWADRELELRPNVPYGDPDRLPRTHERWGDRGQATPELHREAGYWRDTVLDDLRAYYAMVENLDDNVGRLRDALDRHGLTARTATVFLSDHGELLGSHGLIAKQHPHEESVGIPFVVSYPDGGIDGGDVVETPTRTEDWFPTVCGLAGVDPGETPGADLTATMRAGEATLDREGVLLEFVREDRAGMPYAEETWRAFRTARYKYTVKGDLRGAEPWQLFDLEADPHEQENLIGDDETLAARLHGLLRDALVGEDDPYALRAAYGHDALNVAAE